MIDNWNLTQRFLLGAVSSLIVGSLNPASALNVPTCEQGSNAARIVACSEELRHEKSPAKRLAALKSRAQAYRWSRRYDYAVNDYNAILALDPNDGEALYGRGWAFENLHKHDLAIADADKLLSMPGMAVRFTVNQLRCRALVSLGRFNEAIAACTQQIHDLTSYIFFIDRGDAYLAASQFDRAVVDFDEALKLDPHAAFAKLGRGDAMLGAKDYAMALAEYEQANQMMVIVSGRAWPIAINRHGLANEALGRRTEAIKDFRAALDLEPHLYESEEALKRLGVSSP